MKSLLADDAAIVVEIICFLGNIIGEASTVPERKQRLERLLVFMTTTAL